MKHLIFRSFPILAMLVLVMGIGVINTLVPEAPGPYLGGLIAGVLGFCYFIQQQKLAETHLFKQLFTEFNARYDTMNDQLARIPPNDKLSPDEENRLIDYLNLCAEEYLFQQQGYILPEVWQTWCRGMLSLFENNAIGDFVQPHLASEAYYGLTLDIIRKGAELPVARPRIGAG
ncbi:MAG: hypothetical protein ABI587_05175 [Gemmatimonadales bacterium]